MLYFYKSISPNPIENLQKYLNYFFAQLFSEVHPIYDHAHYIHPDFKEIIDEYKDQIDDKLSAIFTAYMGLQPPEKQIVQNAYNINNRIADICNMTVKPIKYKGLPKTIRASIEDLYDNLWGDNKILGYVKVVAKCGTLKSHFTKFREQNEFVVCPFCGLESLVVKSDDGKDDYDHYLPKSKYPFISVNFENLLPMCHKCNSKSKGQVDTPFIPQTTTQRPLYYPLEINSPNHKIGIVISSKNTDLSDSSNWTLTITCEPATNKAMKESWQSVFKIEKRYKSIISDESKIWKQWIINKHRRLCKKNAAPYATFYYDAINEHEDYLNIDKGILLKSFYEFILNDPNCESYLDGSFTI